MSFVTSQTKIRKVEIRPDLDPDFGNIQPNTADAYMISVTPRTSQNRYKFITLLPETESVETAYKLLDKVMTEFLNKGDHYTVRDFTDEHAEDYVSKGSMAPIISFDPDSLDTEHISFLWLVPPKFLMQ